MKKILFFLIFLLCISNVFSQYYADVEIYVERDGIVSIEGLTNHPLLQNISNSQQYTSKNKGIWTFNLTINDNFDNFIYELNLPEYSQINYIKTTPTFRITEEENRIKLIGTGENRSLTIVVQYTIDTTKQIVDNTIYFFIGIFLAIIIIIIFISYIIYKLGIKNKKNTKEIKNDKMEEDKEEFDYSILPQRQKEIINIVKKNGKITQKEIENMMQIPKLSISRNIQTLVVKGILKKENIGQTNYISLKNK